jgi:hypothetical protein
MVWDEVRQRLVLFGGLSASFNTALSDTWEWDGTTWTQRLPATSPPPLWNHAMAWDPARQRVVLLGVARVGAVDQWEWDGVTWTQRVPATSPPERVGHAMAWDAARQRLVLFGGSNRGYYSDTWEWDGATWTQRVPQTSPPARAEHTLVWDPTRQRIVLFGGEGVGGSFGWVPSDTWEWDGTTWTQRLPPRSPTVLGGHAMAWDAVRQRSLVFGGYDGNIVLSDFWEFDGATWTPRVPLRSPPARSAHAMAWDTVRQRLILFAGRDRRGALADTWEWDGNAWTQRVPVGVDGGSSACDPTCPSSSVCSSGVCIGGSRTGVTLNQVSYTVSGSVTVNGGTPTRSVGYCNASGNANQELAVLTFTGAKGSQPVTFAFTCGNTASGFAYSVTLPPDTYKVGISRSFYADLAAINIVGNASAPPVLLPALTVGGNLSNVVLNQTPAIVSVSVTVNGAAPTRDATFCSDPRNGNQGLGGILFVPPGGGVFRESARHLFTCANTVTGFNFSLALAAGTYDVLIDTRFVNVAAGGNFGPFGRRVLTGISVSGTQPITIDTSVATVSGSLTVNGAPPTRNATWCNQPGNANADLGEIIFRGLNEQTSFSFTCANTASGFSWSVQVPYGTYEVTVTRGVDAQLAGVNLLSGRYRVRSALQVNANLVNVVLAEASVAVSGTVTVNGVAPTRSTSFCNAPGNASFELGTVSFFDAGQVYFASYVFTCGNTGSGFNFMLALPQGTYTVQVSARGAGRAGVNLLTPDTVVRTGLVVSGPLSSLVLAETGYSVSGTLLVNGVAPTRSITDCASMPSRILGSVVFSNPTLWSATYEFTCDNTVSGFGWSMMLPPATYDVSVDGTSHLERVGLVVSANRSNLVLDKRSVTVSGVITVNGAAPTRPSRWCSQRLGSDVIGSLEISRSGAPASSSGLTGVVFTCASTAASGFTFSVPVPIGTVDLRFRPETIYATNVTEDLVRGSRTGVVVSGPVSNLVVPLVGYPVSGSVTVNGLPPTRIQSFCGSSSNAEAVLGRVVFYDEATQARASYDFTCGNTALGFNWAVMLNAGTYAVRIERGAQTDAAGVNLGVDGYLAIAALAVP